jgi:uncharacterized membrane protein
MMNSESGSKSTAGGKKRAGGKIDTRQMLPAIFIIVSCVWIYTGMTQFGFWNPLKGGTPAFIPIIIATVLLIASSVMLLKSFKKEERPVYTPLCFFLLLLWLKLVEKAPWKGTLVVSACLAGIGYGLFQFWLKVPFPAGLLFDLFG